MSSLKTLLILDTTAGGAMEDIYMMDASLVMAPMMEPHKQIDGGAAPTALTAAEIVLWLQCTSKR